MDFKKYNIFRGGMATHSLAEYIELFRGKNSFNKLSYNGIKINEDIPTEEIYGYMQPKFSYSQIVNSEIKDEIKSIVIQNFLLKPEEIYLFNKIEELVLDEESVDFYLQKVPKENIFFKIELNKFSNLKQLGSFRLKNIEFKDSNVTHLNTWSKYSAEEFDTIDENKNIIYLIHHNSPVKNLDFVRKFPSLKCVHFRNLEKVSDLTPLKELKELIELKIENCNNLDYNTLESNSLQKLSIIKEFESKNNSIKTISFVENLSNLHTLNVSCKIIDENLLPLKNHKTLRNINIYQNN